jgi:glycosyltransferase involved in cell wall biosynthesis
MKVLHVSPWPGPPFDGGNINRFNFLKRLAPFHRCRFVIFRTAEESAEMTGEALAALGIPNEGVETVTIPKISIYDRLRGLLGSTLPPGVAFYERMMGNTLREKVRTSMAVWQAESLVVWAGSLASILAGIKGVRKILYACDSMSMLNGSIAAGTNSPLRKFYNRLVARRYAYFEKTFLPCFDEVIFISQRDADIIGLPSSLSVSIICNGVDVETFRPLPRQAKKPLPPRILFHGHLGYIPNQEAAHFLTVVVGRRLERQLGRQGFEIRIIGRGAGDQLKSLLQNYPWTKLTGYVKNLPRELATGAIYVAPISMGGGVKNKVLEALACGLPVVGTPEAFSGLEITPGVHCLVSPLDNIAEAVVSLLPNTDRCFQLGEEARSWVMKNANWEILSSRLATVMLKSTIRDSTMNRQGQN